MQGFLLLKLAMKIVTWNCNMAFRKKAAVISAFSPDILVVPECECPNKLLLDTNVPKPKQTLWFGENQNKGLGIFSYSNYTFKLVDTHNPKLKQLFL